MGIYVQKVDKEATENKKIENEASRKRAERATKKYMKTVKEFIKTKMVVSFLLNGSALW